jgi:hypothetical protein
VLVVRWAHRCRADAASEDYDAALEAEARMVAAVLALDTNADLSVSLTRSGGRTSVGDGTMYVGAVEFAVLHRLPLAGTVSA